jgi:hypothetical protein
MTLDYQKIWNTMNELEMVTSKIVSAREILDSAIDRLQEHQYDKTETLLYAVDEFLQYYLEEFDRKFKDAWKETVVKLKQQEIDDCMPPWGHSDLEYGLANPTLTEDRNSNFPGGNTICDNQDTSPECKGAWNSFWEDDPIKEDKVVKWQLPIEEVENGDTGEQEYFITFPEDLLEAANLKLGDIVSWIDNGDGTYTLKHKTMSDTITPHDPYKDEMIAAGYKMVDGVWTKIV